MKKQAPVIVASDSPREAAFITGIEPGRTYTVLVKTVAVNVASWPTYGNVTTRPLPVLDLKVNQNLETGQVELSWQPNNASLQDSYKIVYQEVEAFNGDARTLVTGDTRMSSELYPGRNYTVSVYSLSNMVHSAAKIQSILTRPASPIIKEMVPLTRGLNISWQSDVTSRQDKYAVIVTRNDTDKTTTYETTENHALLTGLYPGAGYHLKVYAIANGNWSEPHVYFQAVFPNSVSNLTISASNDSSVDLSWTPPEESIFSHYMVRYKTSRDSQWMEAPPANFSSARITGLVAGEKYQIRVTAVSFRVESLHPEELTHVVPPSAIKSIMPVLGSTNVTLEWPRPEGRIDSYEVIWWREAERKAKKMVPGSQATEGISRKVSVSVNELIPGELYMFQVATTSNGLSSNSTLLKTRTSE